MATKIITKNSSTTTAIPTAGDLVQGELAVNVTDKRLFTENAAGAIVELGTSPSTIDINAGTIDGTVIGGTTAAAGSFTTGAFSGAVTATGNLLNFNSGAGNAPYIQHASNSLDIRGGTGSTRFLNNAASQATVSIRDTGNVSGSGLDLVGTLTTTGAATFSGNVGIGVTPNAWAPSVYKAIQLGTSNGVGVIAARVDAVNEVNFGLNWYYDGGTNVEYTASSYATNYAQGSGAHRWKTAASGTAGANITWTDAMTLDASGNLLVGKTSVGSSLIGSELNPTGYVVTSCVSDFCGYFNRTTTDGGILQFRKDNAAVGSIGTAFGQLTIGNGGSGLMFVDAAPDRVLPSTSTGAAADGLIDLGDNDDRFKDLYLSGGVYLGGAGAANKLDDYEEGTWIPTDQSGAGLTLTVNSASYTKIGRLCYVYGYVTYPSNTNGAGSGIGGLPFQAASGNNYAQLSVRVTSDTVSANNLTFQVAAASSLGNVHNGASVVLNSALSTNAVLISGVYTVA